MTIPQDRAAVGVMALWFHEKCPLLSDFGAKTVAVCDSVNPCAARKIPMAGYSARRKHRHALRFARVAPATILAGIFAIYIGIGISALRIDTSVETRKSGIIGYDKAPPSDDMAPRVMTPTPVYRPPVLRYGSKKKLDPRDCVFVKGPFYSPAIGEGCFCG